MYTFTITRKPDAQVVRFFRDGQPMQHWRCALDDATIGQEAQRVVDGWNGVEKPQMRVLDLYSGIAGMHLATVIAGGYETVGFSEIDPMACAVLAHHYPDIPNLGDCHAITEEVIATIGPIDVVAAGFPCQGNSTAGKRKGRDDSRNLWPETARILRLSGAEWFVGENVRGLLSANVDARKRDHGLFGDIQRDLARMGFTSGWAVLSASDAGAPHQRDRVCLIAHRDAEHIRCVLDFLADACSRQCDWRARSSEGWNALPKSESGYDSHRCRGTMADTISNESERRRRPRPLARTPGTSQSDDPEWQWFWDAARNSSASMGNTPVTRLPQRGPARQSTPPTQGRTGLESELERSGGVGVGQADSNQARLSERDGRTGTSRACTTVDECGAGQTQPGLGDTAHGIPRWVAGRWPAGPGQTQHEWEAPRTVTEKVTDRASKLKALGNAIVPLQFAPVFAAINAAEAALYESEAA